jgi:flagellar hook assembly protein FlgD
MSPNPTPSGTQVRFELARDVHVRLELLDVSGRVVATLSDGMLPAGRHVAAWNGVARSGRVAPGLYIVRLTTPDLVTQGKLAVIR